MIICLLGSLFRQSHRSEDELLTTLSVAGFDGEMIGFPSRLLGVRQVLVLGFPRFVEKHPCQALRIELGGDGGTRC